MIKPCSKNGLLLPLKETWRRTVQEILREEAVALEEHRDSCLVKVSIYQ